jgi:ribosomal protein L11 methyltransferase
MAFGTGLHATRVSAARTGEACDVGHDRADVGTVRYSGVGAALLGASYVEATDIDPLAVRIARENVAVNHMEDRVTVEEASSPPAGTVPAYRGKHPRGCHPRDDPGSV